MLLLLRPLVSTETDGFLPTPVPVAEPREAATEPGEPPPWSGVEPERTGDERMPPKEALRCRGDVGEDMSAGLTLAAVAGADQTRGSAPPGCDKAESGRPRAEAGSWHLGEKEAKSAQTPRPQSRVRELLDHWRWHYVMHGQGRPG